MEFLDTVLYSYILYVKILTCTSTEFVCFYITVYPGRRSEKVYPYAGTRKSSRRLSACDLQETTPGLDPCS